VAFPSILASRDVHRRVRAFRLRAGRQEAVEGESPETPLRPATRGRRRMFRTAEQAIRDGDLDQGAGGVRAGDRDQSNMTSAHIGMADIYRMRGNYEKAEQRYAR